MSFNLFKKLRSPAKKEASSSIMPPKAKKVTDELEASPDLQAAKTEMTNDDEEMATSNMSAIKNALEEIANGSKLNDHRILGELPYFGISENSSKSWVVSDCNEFLEYITKATAGPHWNNSGRISVLR